MLLPNSRLNLEKKLMSSTSEHLEQSAPKTGGKQDVYLKLRDRIIRWHYPPGFHLGEKALCDEFKVSRVPVREALRALTAEGFVDKVPNQGCYVKQLNVEETTELFEVRLAMELHIGELLTETPPASTWIAEQRAHWTQMLHPPESTLDVSTFVAADTEFHLGLARACGNKSMLRIVEDVTERLRFIRLAVEATPERLQETATEHLAILDAIESKNPDQVRKAIKGNIDHSSNRVELAISRALLAAHAMH